MKNEEHFNTYSRFGKEYTRGYCRNCERVQKREYKQRIKNLLKTEEDVIYGSASEDYDELPNHYTNEEQRLAVFRILKLLGYSFNRSLGIWYKLPFKLQDGTYTNLKHNGVCVYKQTNSVIHTNKIPELYKMADEGISKKQMALHFKVQTATIIKYLAARERKLKKNGNS
jgi:hypothetical protein